MKAAELLKQSAAEIVVLRHKLERKQAELDLAHACNGRQRKEITRLNKRLDAMGADGAKVLA